MDADCQERLAWAIKESGLSTVRESLARSEGPNSRLPNEGSPLWLAAGTGRGDVVGMLLDEGADIDEGGSGFASPLAEAIRCGYEDLAKVLLERGANPNGMSKAVFTPLHVSVRQASLEMVALVVSAGADLEARSGDGWTPAHVALSDSRWDVFVALMEAGADLQARTGRGKGLEDLAEEARKDEVRALVELHALSASKAARCQSGARRSV